MTVRHPHVLRRSESILVVVDMQEPFLGGVTDRKRLLENVSLLIQCASILKVPVLPTVQYSRRMGGVVPEIASLLSATAGPPLDKLSFSCAGQPEFMARLTALSRRQILVCGVETHICVAQTAMDLVSSGFGVHVAVDAVSSRTMEKHKLGMERMRDSGVLPCAAEAAIYELLGEAGSPEFKTILGLVKQNG